MKNFRNLEGHNNPISGSEVTALDLAFWWSCIGKGLRLQPDLKAPCHGKIKQQVQVFLDNLGLFLGKNNFWRKTRKSFFLPYSWYGRGKNIFFKGRY